MKKIVFAATAATLLAGAAAIAQPAPQAPGRVQDRMDGTDQPARIVTREGLVGHVRTMFARVDSNRDGFITREEAAAVGGHRRAKAARANIARANPAQVAERRARAFQRLDTNRDGSISASEWNARPQSAQQGQFRRPGDRADTVRGLGMAASGLRGRMFDMADADRDGRVSIQEATASAQRHFDMVDANRDGTVSPEERRQSRERLRAQRQRG